DHACPSRHSASGRNPTRGSCSMPYPVPPATSVPPPVPRRPHPLVNRNFALLWAGQLISTLGDTVLDTSLVLWFATGGGADRAWAPLAVSGLLAAATLPVLLLRPLAGVLVDRWDKRRALLVMDALHALLIALLLALTAIPGFPPAVRLAEVA